ncbi:MAG TPA: hypothetical protein VEL09_17045, partial [Burkholderiales bacterium]|nr:hypothetical protein [Burkholderiales bacterium]
MQQRVDIRKTLMDKELGSKLTYFEILQLLLEQQAELGVQKSHLQEAEAAVAAIRETRRQAEAEYRRTVSDELAKSEQKANGLAQDLIKAEQKTRLQLLTAPVDGVVSSSRSIRSAALSRLRSPCWWSCPATAGWKSRPWCRTATLALSNPDKKPRSRSTPSISPATASCTAGCSAS